VIRLATFGELVADGVLEIGDGYRAKLDELGSNGLLFLRAKEVADGAITYDGDRFRPELRARLTLKLGLPGDVVITTKGASTGRTASVRTGAPEFVYSPHLSFWRSRDHSVLDPAYLTYWARSNDCKQQVAAMAASTDMSLYLSLADQRRLRIALPPIELQQAVGALLGTLDDKIELNRRMNETLEEVVDAIFEDRSRRADVVRLETVADLSRTSVDPAAAPDALFEHFSIPAFDEGRMPKLEHGREIRSAKLVVAPDAVLLSKLNPRIPRVWLSDLSGAARPVCSTEFLVALPKPPFSRPLLYALLRSAPFADAFAGLVTGTSGSHQRAKAADALALPVLVPRERDFAELTTTMGSLLERSVIAVRESRILAELRDTLLPKLISGELRVRDAESVVEAADPKRA
jgi:type I restriction enzyme S subunit